MSTVLPSQTGSRNGDPAQPKLRDEGRRGRGALFRAEEARRPTTREARALCSWPGFEGQLGTPGAATLVLRYYTRQYHGRHNSAIGDVTQGEVVQACTES